ncbi:sensor histidine kinase [Cerasicoccus frondis]|uniref:sensor histidine kinase n=1 Tax=Cerasicoccus frondis TaxID=490090 RepID=UPI00285279EC|nr:ATP-binding protein [Cerasicoccus frondis]
MFAYFYKSFPSLAELPSLFSTDDFPLRWQCGIWSETHGWVHIISDIAIWLAYMAIPFAIFYYVRKRPDVPNQPMFYLFIAFIMLCGITHLLEAMIFWWPAYRFLGLMKLLTAIVSIATVIGLLPMLPKLVAAPTTKELEGEIARRKISEKQNAESEELFRNAMKYAPIGKAIVSLDGKFLRVNQKLCELFDYEEDELLSMDFQQITHADDLDKDLELFQKTVAGEIDEYSLEKRYLKRNGSIVHALLNVVLIRSDGEPQYFISQIVDISTQKKLLQRQESLIHELEQKSKDMQQIVYVASHDLRSPLVNIIGFSSELDATAKDLEKQLRAGESLSPEVEAILNNDLPEMLHFIGSSARRMDRLLKGLLQYSRLGRYQLVTQRLDMNRLFDDMQQDLSFQLNEIGATVEIGELPDCYGDLTLISQLFANLVDNAIKYRSPDRPLHIKVSAEVLAMHIRYSIEDNGIGIDEKYVRKIFEVFHRLNPDQTAGEGLGLSICSLIAHRMEGDIYLDSKLGAGSKFHVELPRDEITLSERADAIADAGLNQDFFHS